MLAPMRNIIKTALLVGVLTSAAVISFADTPKKPAAGAGSGSGSDKSAGSGSAKGSADGKDAGSGSAKKPAPAPKK